MQKRLKNTGLDQGFSNFFVLQIHIKTVFYATP